LHVDLVKKNQRLKLKGVCDTAMGKRKRKDVFLGLLLQEVETKVNSLLPSLMLK
jgi:hypothetical protein